MSDEDIIKLFFSRSETALTELQNKYDTFARSVAMNILHDKLDTDECMNDSYLGIWNSIPPQIPKVLPAFFTSVTRNIALKIYRYKSAVKRNAVIEELTDYITGIDVAENEIDMISSVISKFLEQQEKKARVLFMRRYYLGESIIDAAKAVGISENNASVKLSRLREKLKKKLKEEGISI